MSKHQKTTKHKKTRTGPSRPEHNADHKNEQTPDNRANPKQKPAPVLHRRKILVHYHHYHHSLQETQQVGVKITQNQITNLKVIKEDQQTHNQQTHNNKQTKKQILNNLIGM